MGSLQHEEQAEKPCYKQGMGECVKMVLVSMAARNGCVFFLQLSAIYPFLLETVSHFLSIIVLPSFSSLASSLNTAT